MLGACRWFYNIFNKHSLICGIWWMTEIDVAALICLLHWSRFIRNSFRRSSSFVLKAPACTPRGYFRLFIVLFRWETSSSFINFTPFVNQLGAVIQALRKKFLLRTIITFCFPLKVWRIYAADLLNSIVSLIICSWKMHHYSCWCPAQAQMLTQDWQSSRAVHPVCSSLIFLC